MDFKALITSIANNVTDKYDGVYAVDLGLREEFVDTILAIEDFIKNWDVENIDVDFDKDNMGFIITMESFYVEETVADSSFVCDVIMRATGLSFEATEEARTKWTISIPGIWVLIAN